MIKIKSTQLALVSSIISLLLSCAMLLGTTYAWFTDSVANSNTRIVSGNLEIDLLMDKTEEGRYVSIADGKGDIFAESNGGDDVMWEPGKLEIVYLAVENTGNLALKYNIKLDVEGELAGALEYAVLEGMKAEDIASASWEAIKGRPDAQTGKLKAGLIDIVPEGKLKEKKDKDYYAVAVYMPGNAAYKFQGKSITVDLTLAATQTSFEKDSYGNRYDKDAEISDSSDEIVVDDSVVTVNNAIQLMKLNEILAENQKQAATIEIVELGADIDMTGTVWTPVTNCNIREFNGNGHTISNLTIEGNGTNTAMFSVVNPEMDKFTISKLTFDNVNVTNTTGKYTAVVIGSTTVNTELNDVDIKNSEIVGMAHATSLIGCIDNEEVSQIIVKIKDCEVLDTEIVSNVTNTSSRGASGLFGRLTNDIIGPQNGLYNDVELICENCALTKVTITTAGKNAEIGFKINTGSVEYLREYKGVTLTDVTAKDKYQIAVI